MRTSKKLYSPEAVNKAVETLLTMGYEMMEVAEGCLLEWGKMIMVAPDEKHYNYIFTETYVNCWSSAYRVARRSKLSDKDVAPEW